MSAKKIRYEAQRMEFDTCKNIIAMLEKGLNGIREKRSNMLKELRDQEKCLVTELNKKYTLEDSLKKKLAEFENDQISERYTLKDNMDFELFVETEIKSEPK